MPAGWNRWLPGYRALSAWISAHLGYQPHIIKGKSPYLLLDWKNTFQTYTVPRNYVLFLASSDVALLTLAPWGAPKIYPATLSDSPPEYFYLWYSLLARKYRNLFDWIVVCHEMHVAPHGKLNVPARDHGQIGEMKSGDDFADIKNIRKFKGRCHMFTLKQKEGPSS